MWTRLQMSQTFELGRRTVIETLRNYKETFQPIVPSGAKFVRVYFTLFVFQYIYPSVNTKFQYLKRRQFQRHLYISISYFSFSLCICYINPATQFVIDDNIVLITKKKNDMAIFQNLAKRGFTAF